MQKITFIGAGHITEILINNLIKFGKRSSSDITVSDPDKNRTSILTSEYAVSIASDNVSGINSADVVFICVHPNIVPVVIKDIEKADYKKKIFISVSAGVPLSFYEKDLDEVKLVRILPNPPSKIGEGAVPVAMNKRLSNAEKDIVSNLLKILGSLFIVTEDKIDIFTSITSPAPVLTVFESMIDAAVLCGLDYETSSAMVKQTVKGCLMMWGKNGMDIKGLITQACTPGGTSVESLRIMDKMGLRSAIKESYLAAYKKSQGFAKS